MYRKYDYYPFCNLKLNNYNLSPCWTRQIKICYFNIYLNQSTLD